MNRSFKVIFYDHHQIQGVSQRRIRQEISGKQIDLEDEGCLLPRNVCNHFADNTA
jgi:hypothetical protein